ncbi:MAG TPA: hypothetical protein VN777_06640 [Terriglobales bacterium]|nr:hypothetical protein [Terriglobales bacterium]
MRTWRQAGRLSGALALLWVALAWTTGCSRQAPVPATNAPPDATQLPFDRVSENSGISPTDGLISDGIPAGTEVAIRLQLALSSADSRVGDSFQAVLAEPVIVAGKTVVPQGTPVAGSVVAAKASGGVDDPGYLRVTLASIAMNGKSVPLHTSSIFAKGGSYEKRKPATLNRSEASGQSAITEPVADSGSGAGISYAHGPSDVRFSTGHRLTFRLARPLHL